MTAPSKHNSPPTDRVLLTARDLHKTYKLGRVDVPVLHGASIDVAAGEWVAILGSSGSGKSTLLHLLGDLDKPDPASGDIAFDGRSLRAMSAAQRNRYRNQSVGFVFQFYHLLPELTVLENAMIPALVGKRGLMAWSQPLLFAGLVPGMLAEWAAYARASIEPKQRARAVLDSFGLAHRLRHRPRELSGGERQRVAIARALMNDPRILLADEPTGNLDEHTGGEILDLIAGLHRRGLTIAMVTHDPKVAGRADRIVHLQEGRVVEQPGPPAQPRAKSSTSP